MNLFQHGHLTATLRSALYRSRVGFYVNLSHAMKSALGQAMLMNRLVTQGLGSLWP